MGVLSEVFPRKKGKVMSDPTISSEGYGVEYVYLRPEDAARILENNHVNRKLRASTVAAYQRDMQQGRWSFTGEPIQISRTGALLNGQHRMSALAKCKSKRVVDKGIPFVLVTGLPDEAQTLMDQGMARTVADALNIQFGHIKNATNVSSLTRWLTIQPHLDAQFSPSTLRTKVSTAEIVAFYKKHGDDIHHCIERTLARRTLIPGSPTAIAYCYYQFRQLDPEQAEEFFAGMADMEWAFKDDPRKAALKRIQIIVSDKDYRANLENAVLIMSVLSRAWNLWRKGESVSTIVARSRTGPIPPVKPV